MVKDPDALADELYPNLRNRAMARKLATGEALDVRTLMAAVEPAGDALVFTLMKYVDEKDYCDTETEQWIWSIGRRLADGAILAATDARFYYPEKDGHECLWLR